MKINFLKQKKKFRKGGFHTNPDICWEIAVYVAIIIVTGMLAFGIYIFLQIDQDFTLPDSGVVAAGTIREEKINHALNYFAERAEKSQQILNSPSPIIDPSL